MTFAYSILLAVLMMTISSPNDTPKDIASLQTVS